MAITKSRKVNKLNSKTQYSTKESKHTILFYIFDISGSYDSVSSQPAKNTGFISGGALR